MTTQAPVRARPVSIPVQRVRDHLIAAAQDEALAPGQGIGAAELAAALDLDDTAVLMALTMLTDEGFLHVGEDGALAIPELGTTEVLDLYNARAGVEGFSARLLAERNESALNRRLLAVIEDAVSTSEHDSRAYFAANHRIHRAMVAGTENRFLLESFDSLWRRGAVFGLFATIEKVDFAASLAEHTALVEAIATGDGSLAAERMIAHVRDGYFLKLDASMRDPF